MEELKLYNLPQRVEGGMPIEGAKNSKGEDIVILFHNLDGMYSKCSVQDTDESISLSASTPLIYEDGKYRFAEEIGG